MTNIEWFFDFFRHFIHYYAIKSKKIEIKDRIEGVGVTEGLVSE